MDPATAIIKKLGGEAKVAGIAGTALSAPYRWRHEKSRGEIDPRYLSLVDLEPGDCRFPYGGDKEGEAITFCGRPRRQGTSYCAAHFYLTRGPDAAPERAGGTVSLRLVEAA
jgi:hypothetical protein